MTTLSSLAATIAADASNSSTTTGYYLPFVILSQPLSLDPMQAGSLTLGPLATISASLQGTLCSTLQSHATAAPNSAPVLQLTDAVLSGLSNVVLGTPSVDGGDVTLPLTFEGAAMPAGFSVPSALCLSGNFTIDLPCSNGSTFDTTVSGTLQLQIGSSAAAPSLTAVLSVSPLGSDGSLLSNSAVTVSSLALASGTAISVLSLAVTSPSSPNVVQLSSALTTALETTTGASAIVAALNQALASETVGNAVGDALTTVLPTLINPPLLATILTLVYAAATTPGNAVYLPTAILAASNPVLDPFAAGGPYDLGNMNAINPDGGQLICSAVGPATEEFLNTPDTSVDLTVTNLVVTGLSNITLAAPLVIQPPNVQTNTVYGLAALGTLADWSTQLLISGGFTLSLSCCPTTDNSTCSGPSAPYSGSGTFSAAIASAMVSAVVTVGTSGDNLTATVEQVSLHIDPNIVNPSNVVWTITIDGDVSPVWTTEVERDFNSAPATAAILAQVETSMNEPSVLQSLGSILTNTLQNGMTAAAVSR